MSYISFQNKGQMVKVSGRERAWFRCLVDNLCTSILDLALGDPNNYSAIKAALAPKHDWIDAHNPKCSFAEQIKMALRIALVDQGVWHGEPLDLFNLKLNTTLVLGGGVLKLAARIHGQCEVHGFIRAENGPWAARIIRQGLKTYIFRQDNAGYDEWKAVADLLEHTKGTVVMDYSVTDSFPGGVLTQEERENEVWPSWEACLYRLTHNYPDREICPENWDSLFDHKLTLLDLIKEWNGD